MSNPLFNEFDKASSKAWKQKIQVDLKGADYNDTLIWQTAENINVKPFYHPDEFTPENWPSLSPSTPWKIGQMITVTDEVEANTQAKDAIARGVEAILFKVTKPELNLEVLTQYLASIPLSFRGDFSKDLNNASLTKFNDPIHQLVSTGNWYSNKSEDFKHLVSQIRSRHPLAIDSTVYQNAGATMVQQLAYMFGQINEYLNHFKTIEDFKFSELKLQIHTAVGGNYFFEIAKIRAMRLLWRTLSKVYDADASCMISVEPSKRNKSIYDYNVNMLRTTTESMSAVLGGADIIYNQPYDALYHKANEFGDRISRNQLLILKKESYFDHVQNASDGSYYIESLTHQLADKALDILKGIEDAGGFIQQLISGTIQRKIKESAKAEQAQFDSGELVLLGVNTFPNDNDKMANDLEINPFLEVNKRKTLIEPVIQKRLAENLEKQRLEQE